jgi:ribosomal protein L16/L10AE
MFRRYDIADHRDKLAALEAARRFANHLPSPASCVIAIDLNKKASND